jgi:protein-tyrosine phosphatase
MRDLAWDGCHNVRDLGGLPLSTGGETRHGVVVRADSLGQLTDRGWAAALEYGVTRVVDLRFSEERARDPSARDGVEVEVVHVSLFGQHDPRVQTTWVAKSRAATDAVEMHTASYLYTVEHQSENVGSAISAAVSTGGCAAVQCAAGKDRTGIVAALLLSLAGVDDTTISEDYAASDPGVGRLLAEWLAEAGDDAEREYRNRISRSPAEAMTKTLDHIRDRWGGAEEYLVANGVSAAALRRFRSRIAA